MLRKRREGFGYRRPGQAELDPGGPRQRDRTPEKVEKGEQHVQSTGLCWLNRETVVKELRDEKQVLRRKLEVEKEYLRILAEKELEVGKEKLRDEKQILRRKLEVEKEYLRMIAERELEVEKERLRIEDEEWLRELEEAEARVKKRKEEEREARAKVLAVEARQRNDRKGFDTAETVVEKEVGLVCLDIEPKTVSVAMEGGPLVVNQQEPVSVVMKGGLVCLDIEPKTVSVAMEGGPLVVNQREPVSGVSREFRVETDESRAAEQFTEKLVAVMPEAIIGPSGLELRAIEPEIVASGRVKRSNPKCVVASGRVKRSNPKCIVASGRVKKSNPKCVVASGRVRRSNPKCVLHSIARGSEEEPQFEVEIGQNEKPIVKALAVGDHAKEIEKVEEFGLVAEGEKGEGQMAVFRKQYHALESRAGGTGSSDRRPVVTCFRCGGPGHKVVDCWQKVGGSESARPSAGGSRTIVCFTCGVEGHRSPQCPKRGQESEKSKEGQGQARPVRKIWHRTEEDTVVEGVVNGKEVPIVLDSGATISVVPESMVEEELLTGEVVLVMAFQSREPVTLPTAKVRFKVEHLEWEEVVALAPTVEGQEAEVLCRLVSVRASDLVLRANALEQARVNRIAKVKQNTSRRERNMKQKWQGRPVMPVMARNENSRSQCSSRLRQAVVVDEEIVLEDLGAREEEVMMEDLGFESNCLGIREEEETLKGLGVEKEICVANLSNGNTVKSETGNVRETENLLELETVEEASLGIIVEQGLCVEKMKVRVWKRRKKMRRAQKGTKLTQVELGLGEQSEEKEKEEDIAVPGAGTEQLNVEKKLEKQKHLVVAELVDRENVDSSMAGGNVEEKVDSTCVMAVGLDSSREKVEAVELDSLCIRDEDVEKESYVSELKAEEEVNQELSVEIELAIPPTKVVKLDRESLVKQSKGNRSYKSCDGYSGQNETIVLDAEDSILDSSDNQRRLGKTMSMPSERAGIGVEGRDDQLKQEGPERESREQLVAETRAIEKTTSEKKDPLGVSWAKGKRNEQKEEFFVRTGEGSGVQSSNQTEVAKTAPERGVQEGQFMLGMDLVLGAHDGKEAQVEVQPECSSRVESLEIFVDESDLGLDASRSESVVVRARQKTVKFNGDGGGTSLEQDLGLEGSRGDSITEGFAKERMVVFGRKLSIMREENETEIAREEMEPMLSGRKTLEKVFLVEQPAEELQDKVMIQDKELRKTETDSELCWVLAENAATATAAVDPSLVEEEVGFEKGKAIVLERKKVEELGNLVWNEKSVAANGIVDGEDSDLGASSHLCVSYIMVCYLSYSLLFLGRSIVVNIVFCLSLGTCMERDRARQADSIMVERRNNRARKEAARTVLDRRKDKAKEADSIMVDRRNDRARREAARTVLDRRKDRTNESDRVVQEIMMKTSKLVRAPVFSQLVGGDVGSSPTEKKEESESSKTVQAGGPVQAKGLSRLCKQMN